MVMGSPGTSADRIEALRSMLDRLCAPDLTLSEAKQLVPNLSTMLEADPAAGDRVREGAGHARSSRPDR